MEDSELYGRFMKVCEYRWLGRYGRMERIRGLARFVLKGSDI